MIVRTLLLLLASLPASAATGSSSLTWQWPGILALSVFTIAYLLIVFEEKLHLRKSKPIVLSAGLIWAIIAIAQQTMGLPGNIEEAIRHNFLEYTEMFFFLLVAMTYINAMLERGLFDKLRDYLVQRHFSYRTLFWLTSWLAFFLSPIADNLTTALVMCAVVMAVGQEQPRFITLSCISIVVAANAGGAFSPFGDITTLMVWQKGLIQFQEFFALILPSIVNFLLPALVMSLVVPQGTPTSSFDQVSQIKPGGWIILALFLITIGTAVVFHNWLGIPPVYGMLLGFSYLTIFGYLLNTKQNRQHGVKGAGASYDVFNLMARIEWDTLLFFYGVILAVGGLGYLGYLNLASTFFYQELGPTTANVMVGLLSAVVDNIPVMFAVLTMNPEMSNSQWLLATLTAGTGGSLLAVGSAAGVALMGQARGYYTFSSHLAWTPVILLGYGASIAMHLWIN